MERAYIRDGRAPIPEKEITSRVMSSIRAKNTKPELRLRKALLNTGLSGYRLHWKKVPGRPDISYPGAKLAIFVHGCYWHRCPHCKPAFPKTHLEFWTNKFQKNKERDERKIKELQGQGWKVLVIWECQIRDNLQEYVELIRKLKSQAN
jgi:DNA mismatch endonuclease, patch repair protein